MVSFKTLAQPVQTELKEKGSRFVAFGYPIENEQDVKKYLHHLMEEYPDATHHCYAFKLGASFRASDAGEPNNSAGLPIYRQILSSGLDGVLVVVVRYFGGKKLGIPGLIKAYGDAAKLCLQQSKTLTVNPTFRFKMTIIPELEYQIFQVASRFHFIPEKTSEGFQAMIDQKMEEALKEYCLKFPNLHIEKLSS